MSFIVVIPARLSSTRLPNKPLADIAGKPMVARVAEQAEKSNAQKIIVATDHQDIMNACAKFGIDAVMTRSDHPSGTDRIAEVAQKMNLSEKSVIVNVQGDEPLIDPELISQTAACIKDEIRIATAAHVIKDIKEFFNPNVVKAVCDENGRALYFSRAPIPWHRNAFAKSQEVFPDGFAPLRHIGIYAYRADFLQTYPKLKQTELEKTEALEQLRILGHGYPIAVHITPNAPLAGVDTPEDLERVRKRFESI